MNVEIGSEAALFPEKEYIKGIFVALYVSVSDLYIPGISPHISCSEIDRSCGNINRSQTHEFENWGCGIAPFLGIFVSNFRYWFLTV
jgi:hypothetical protein